jgi:hypothetical protein
MKHKFVRVLSIYWSQLRNCGRVPWITAHRTQIVHELDASMLVFCICVPTWRYVNPEQYLKWVVAYQLWNLVFNNMGYSVMLRFYSEASVLSNISDSAKYNNWRWLNGFQMHELNSLPVDLLRRLLTDYAPSRSSDYYTRVIELSSFIREWKIVSSFNQEWKMKYYLAIHWGKRRQAFCLTVRHTINHFHYVIAPSDLYTKSIHFLGSYSIYSVLQVQVP